uniref:Uncharacterized protein n=1 Tax=viral metagenome TaxID=1070528 RepID=A0A6C0HMU1_9ZZZZ
MPLNRTKKRKAGTHGKTNNSRSNASETEYFTANDESDEDEDSFTSKSQKTLEVNLQRIGTIPHLKEMFLSSQQRYML